MSCTNRGETRKGHLFDYYITPPQTAKEAFVELIQLERTLQNKYIKILDPCCGGDKIHNATYKQLLFYMDYKFIDTMDIREDSGADTKTNYLTYTAKQNYYDLIISNPPYTVALDFVQKALLDVKDGGFVSYLLRLNFFGSQSRKKFFNQFMPKYCFVHSKRPSFTLDGKTDGTEYATFVWQKGRVDKCTITKIL